MAEKDLYLQQIILFLNNPEDKELENTINEWRLLNSENERYYQDIYKIWQRAAESAPLEQVNVAIAVDKLSAKIGYNPAEAEVIPLRSRFRALKWTAGVAAMLAIAVLVYNYMQPQKPVYITKTTSVAKDSVLLADGSKVYLDAHSTVRYPEKFSGNTRPIYFVAGNAFFKIAKDASKPFFIHMDNTAVRVLGTSFNINKTTYHINIDVKTGRVMFIANRETKGILTAGTAANYNLRTNKLTTYASINQNSDAWLTGQLHFVDEPMADVVKKLEQHYKINIDLDSNLSRLGKLNASFINNNIDEVIAVLEQTYPIKISHKADRLIIRRK
ncbi:FecR domain-containing protein [Mucilaginibacter gynuensis]|uniref:FecR domain-containing protein n=1 Tax=Mucilaginibacter gynuensis TaxID=1302236 RepID=A0ABP8GFV6_9SPHI